MARSDFGFQIGSALATGYLTDSKYIRAGYVAVATLAERDALPIDTGGGGVVVKGVLCYCAADETFYQFDGTQWVEAKLGGGAGKYVGTITGDGSTTTFTIQHDLESRDLAVVIYDATTFDQQVANVAFTTLNTITVAFDTAPAASETYKVACLIPQGPEGKQGVPGKVQDVKKDGTSLVDPETGIANLPDFGKVDDVKVNGTSIVTDKVANIPNASASAAGVMSASDFSKLSGISENAKNVSVAPTGTSTDEVRYITIDGVEKKLAGGNAGFLALWDCATGTPATTMQSDPYTYKVGDYYRVSNVAAESSNYRHTIHMEGPVNGEVSKLYTVDFEFTSNSSAKMTELTQVTDYLRANDYLDRNYLSATGNINSSINIYGVSADRNSSVLIFNDQDATQLANTSTATVVNDTVTPANGTANATNYKPDGSVYSSTGTIAAIETEKVKVGFVYYYNGTDWLMQAAGGLEDVRVNGTTVVTDGIADITIVDNVTSTTTNEALSANMGKSLQDEINNLKNIGRFLSIWDASTGTPSSEPTTSPYNYKIGDYYRIGAEGTKNPANNSTYVVGETNWVEGATLKVGDVVYVSTIDGTTATWVKMNGSAEGTVQDVQINGTTIVGSGTGVANIPLATTTTSGAMSTEQVTKLEGIETGAEVNVLEGVQVNGTDLTITNKKVNIPVASTSTFGVLKVGAENYGLKLNSGNELITQAADDSRIAAKSNGNCPIVPANLDKAVMEGLGNNSLTWSAAYKTSARNTIGAGAPITIEFLGDDE